MSFSCILQRTSQVTATGHIGDAVVDDAEKDDMLPLLLLMMIARVSCGCH